MKTPIKKDQHFVPKMYLKNFSFRKAEPNKKNKKQFIWQYDKQEDAFRNTTISEICYEKYLYEILKGDLNIDTGESRFAKTNDIENYFNKLESVFDKTLRRVLNIIESPENQNSLICNKNDRKVLCELTANLLLRNPIVYFSLLLSYCYYFETQTPLVRNLEIEAEQKNYGDVKPAILCAIEDLILKKDNSRSDFNILIDNLKSLNMYFLYTRNSQFITSSCPVQCLVKDEKLKCAYLPLSPHVALMFNEDYRKHRNRVISIADSEVNERNRYYYADKGEKNRFLLCKEEEYLKKLVETEKMKNGDEEIDQL